MGPPRDSSLNLSGTTPKRPVWMIHGTSDGAVPYSQGQSCADALALPTALFPGLGKPYGDFLQDDDPLQALCGKKVHRSCFDAWPVRARFVGAYLDWMTGRLRDDPDRGTAYADSTTFVSAP